jgi:hypothetical protein
MLNLGVRHESQTHLSDWRTSAPRLGGANWTPSARLHTTLRGSYSVSFQPFQGTTYGRRCSSMASASVTSSSRRRRIRIRS